MLTNNADIADKVLIIIYETQFHIYNKCVIIVNSVNVFYKNYSSLKSTAVKKYRCEKYRTTKKLVYV